MSVELSTAIAELRKELTTAMEQGRDAGAPRLRLDSVELELEVSVESTTGANGGVKFYIVNAGVSGQKRSARSNRVKLVLHPEDLEGSAVYTNDAVSNIPD